MKLVELLVKELEEWPEGVTYFVQDGDREVKAGRDFIREPDASRIWVRGTNLDNYNFYSCLCADWQTSVVTKDAYTKHKETQMKRKVRKDFDPTKEYSVDVEDCTEEEKKEVQQAFFDVGFPWASRGKVYQHMDAVDYTNIGVDGSITAYCIYGSTTERCNMTAKEFLGLVYEPEQQGHVHAELMGQYAEDAKTHAEPWKLWQIKTGSHDWIDCKFSPAWDSTCEFRRKSKTHIVHGVEIPDLRISPKQDEWYWCPASHSKWYVAPFESRGSDHDVYRIENGLCYEYTEDGKQAAILHSKSMLGIA